MIAKTLLIVAGEPSGDSLAASIAHEIRQNSHLKGTRIKAVGGNYLHNSGAEIIADIRDFTAMGLLGPIAKAPRLLRLWRTLDKIISTQPIDAAILVNYSEFNARLGKKLRAKGIRVLWLAPPQIWAWRPKRRFSLSKSADKIAVLFSFETHWWQDAHPNVTWVGHPMADKWVQLQEGKSITPNEKPRIAILPGSRPSEIRRHLEVMIRAAEKLCGKSKDYEIHVFFPASLDNKTQQWAQHCLQSTQITQHEVSGERSLLDYFSEHHYALALCSSGTASLECAVAKIPPVIVYRTDWFTYQIAKRLVTAKSIGLPNILLNRPLFREIIQDDVTTDSIAQAAQITIKTNENQTNLWHNELIETIKPDANSFAQRVLSLVEPWL